MEKLECEVVVSGLYSRMNILKSRDVYSYEQTFHGLSKAYGKGRVTTHEYLLVQGDDSLYHISMSNSPNGGTGNVTKFASMSIEDVFADRLSGTTIDHTYFANLERAEQNYAIVHIKNGE